MNKILCVLILLYSGSLFSQQTIMELARGEWCLIGISEFSNYQTNYHLSDMSLDSVLLMKIGVEKITVIKGLKNQLNQGMPDTNYFDYEIITDSTGRHFINFLQKKDRALKKKYKSCSDLKMFEVVKINNSTLVIEKYESDPSTPFYLNHFTRYFFEKKSDTTSMSEFDFYGKWYFDMKNVDIKLMDTIRLSKENLKDHEFRFKESTLSFYNSQSGVDSFSIEVVLGGSVLESSQFIEGFWYFIPGKNIIVMMLEKYGKLSYRFEIEADAIMLFRN